MSNLIVNISTFAEILLLINIILYYFNFKFSKQISIWFNIFLILGLITQIISKILFINSYQNLPLLHIYTLLEFIFLSLFYKDIITKEFFLTKYFNAFIIIMSVLIILNSIFLQNLYTFNSNAKTLTQVIYIGYALVYFFQAPFERSDLSKLLNWINSAILLYYAGSLFIFMASSAFFQLTEMYRFFWVINALLYLIFQILLFVALWTFRQRTRTKSTYL